MINGFTPWTLLLTAGSLTCMPIIPPVAYFTASGNALAFTSTFTHEARVEALDGRTLFSETGPGTAAVALTDNSFWLVRDYGRTLCRLDLPKLESLAHDCIHSAEATFGKLRARGDTLSYWLNVPGSAESDAGGSAAQQWVRYKIAGPGLAAEKLEKITALYGPTWCAGDSFEYSFVRDRRPRFGGDIEVASPTAQTADEVPCATRNGMLAYGIGKRIFVDQSDGTVKVASTSSSAFWIEIWKGYWLLDEGDAFELFTTDLESRVAWGKKPTDIRFVAHDDAIFVVPLQPGRD